MKLIVWLGNPWKEYAKTRHNAGFFVLENILDHEKWLTIDWKVRYSWVYAEWNIDGEKVLFLMPQAYMNKSGESVWPLAHFYKIPAKDILVLHDEIDLPTWKVQLKFWWGTAGHNWLKNIVDKIGTKDFWRLRIGVDRPINKEDVADYVLTNFKKEEREKIEDQYTTLLKYIHEFLST